MRRVGITGVVGWALRQTTALHPLAIPAALLTLLALPLPLPMAGSGLALAQSVEPKAAFDRPLVVGGAATVPLYLEVDFKVAPRQPEVEAKRPPINLALVLDRSGSMEEERKIEYLRKAAILGLDRLAPRDRVAVVEYDDKITVMWPSQTAENLEPLKQRINRLTPRGSTNLAGGLEAGIKEARPHADREGVTRVLLMTDGLANQGVTDPAAIRAIAREAKRQGVRVATIGLGLDFNEKLLQAIAETGGGTYYYVENPKQIAQIFEQEMSALSTTVAKDGVLRLRFGPAVHKVTAIGVPSHQDNGDTVIELEDFSAGEDRSVLLRLDIAPGTTPTRLDLGTLRLSYDDTAAGGGGGGGRHDRDSALTIEVTDNADTAEQAVNKPVAAQAALAEANQAHEQALQQVEAGKAGEAAANLQNLAAGLAARNDTLADRKVAAKIEALKMDAERAAAAPAPSSASAQQMMKQSRQVIYQASRGKTGKLMLQRGDHGPEVARLVEALARSGVYPGKPGKEDEEYDDTVEKAVRSFQQREKLPVDGVAGPTTLNRLGLY